LGFNVALIAVLMTIGFTVSFVAVLAPALAGIRWPVSASPPTSARRAILVYLVLIVVYIGRCSAPIACCGA
jgi:uncharacterized membrane protein